MMPCPRLGQEGEILHTQGKGARPPFRQNCPPLRMLPQDVPSYLLRWGVADVWWDRMVYSNTP